MLGDVGYFLLLLPPLLLDLTLFFQNTFVNNDFFSEHLVAFQVWANECLPNCHLLRVKQTEVFALFLGGIKSLLFLYQCV